MICATRTSLVSGYTTLTRVRAVSLHRTTLSTIHRRKWATGATRVREVVVYVDHSWTCNLSTGKSAALPKHTTRAFPKRVFTPRTPESPQNPEDSQRHNSDRLIFSLPVLSQDAPRLWTSVCVAFSNAAAPRGDAAQAASERRKNTGLDSGRPTTPCSHTNIAVCRRYRVMPYRQQEPSSTDGSMKFRLPSSDEEQQCREQSYPTHQRESKSF